MRKLTISSASREYVRVRIRATEAGTVLNPTTNTVAMAFVTSGDPTTFYSASWETEGTNYYARCLVGPGGTFTPTKDTYRVFVKVTDTPEIPVLFAGYLDVT